MGGTGGFFEVTASLPLFSSVTISSVILNIIKHGPRMQPRDGSERPSLKSSVHQKTIP